jgi:hypothetical protein
VVVGDFNGDGKQDFATANFFSANVSIRLGDGLGGFGLAIDIGVSTKPRSIAVGDFNGDGVQDFAVATSNNSSNNVSIRLGGMNEINLKGNATPIADGDATPSLADHTDFGNVCLPGTIARTFTIENTGPTALQLNAGAITFTGADNALFTVSGIALPMSIAGVSSTTFVVTFSPVANGARTATVHIANNDCDEADYDFVITGTGGTPPAITGPAAVCSGGSATLDAGAGYSMYAWSNSGGSGQTATFSNITLTSIYTVTVTGANGCTCSDTYTVGVNAPLTPTVTGPTSVCSGGSAMLDAGAGYAMYAWSNAGGSGQTVTFTNITSMTTYTMTVTDANGCTGSDTHTVDVADNELPTITCPNPLTVPCAGQVPPVNLASVTANDNCGAPTKSHIGDVTSRT